MTVRSISNTQQLITLHDITQKYMAVQGRQYTGNGRIFVNDSWVSDNLKADNLAIKVAIG